MIRVGIIGAGFTGRESLNRCEKVGRSVLIGLAVLAMFGPGCATVDRPNIVFIMADDLGKEWLSCYGSEEHVTPNLDRLAAGGMRFENAYVTPLCTPTRHELLTGRYPFRTGWTVHHDAPRWGGQYFDWKREVTFARVLRSAGYATAIAGKWQINDLRTHPDALDRHGFDEHCVWTGFETGNPPSAERYFDPFIQENGERRTREGEFGPDVFAEFLSDFITRHKGRPFCAYFPMVLTHTPFTKTPQNPDTQAEGKELFPGMVEYADHLVGRLVQRLEDLGIRDKTVVIFTADNGTVRGVKCRARGRLVNGGKASLTEAGICVPFIANCPGRIPAGRVSDDLVDFTDILPTLAELAGAEPPAGVVIDGKSFADTLLGKPDSRAKRDWIFSQLGKNRVLRDKRFKLCSSGRMYDVVADPLEKNDLAGSDDPEIVAARARLAAVLESLPADAKLPFEPRKPESKAGKPAAGQAAKATFAGKEPAPATDTEGFVSLFAGTTLDGWRRVNGTAEYRVEDGCIVGVCDPKCKANTFLRTERTFKDFVFSADVKFDVPGNSGIQFRSHQKAGNGRVFGYQAEIDQSKDRRWSGGIYDEARRGWLYKLEGDEHAGARQAFDHEGWNTYIIKAEGRRLQTWVNNVPCADFVDTDDKQFTPEGFIALQVHSGKQGTIRWRNIRIRELSPGGSR